MELLTGFKEKGYFTSAVYLLLANKRMVPSNTPIIPSEYVKHMKMSTMERLQNLHGIDIPNIVSPDPSNPKKPMLEFSPRIIVFQNYKCNDKIVTKFTVKNISNGPAFLNMVFKQSSYFMIKPLGAEMLSRLAPGISVSFAITFLPLNYEDLSHSVHFYSNADHYILPLIAIAPRGIFNFPDKVVIPPTPVKFESSTIINLHNIGDIPSGIAIKTKSPFSIYPRFAYLAPDEFQGLKVSFKTMYMGETEGLLIAEFETEEVFHIKLYGTTHAVAIELEKATVRFFDTYSTMAQQQVYKITNKSDELVTYMCMKNEDVFKDFAEKLNLAHIFHGLKESELAKCNKLVHYDVLSSDEHERVYARIFYDEIQSLIADQSLQFQDTHFSITPISGSIWPNKSTELTVTFAPKVIGDLKAVVYLDIDGVPDRIPVTMQGTSLPPNICLNLESLDMANVYINKTYRYQIVVINKGHTTGVIQYKECAPLFGSVITCTPEKHCLPPGTREIFVVSFLNSNQGPYFEELDFLIKDTNIVRKLYLKGTIIYPTLTFGISCLDFGDVSIGKPKTLQVEVINESEVDVKATVKITSDGPEESAITLDDCEASGFAQLHMPQWPREFDIQPSKIKLDANSTISIQITLTANLVRENHTVLELELDKSDSPPIVLPLSYHGRAPEIIPAPDINLRACFLDFTYNYDIIFATNNYWGFFSIAPPEENSTLHVNLAVTRGIIAPNTKVCLPCTIMADVLGLQVYVVRLIIFGYPHPIDICRITAQAVRPIVTCNPMVVNWGQVKLLTKSYRTLTLNNDSPVTVYYKAAMLNKDSRFEISPVEGSISPEAETELTVVVYLLDADNYVNKAVIHLEKVKDILVPLTAIGVGTSIVVGPLRNRIELGRHFCKLPLNFPMSMKNYGTKLHSLEWLEHFKQPRNKPLSALFFDLSPRIFKLNGGEEISLVISGSPPKPAIIKETWFLVGSVEGANKKELLMECEISGEFVDPKIEVYPNQIDLRYDYGPYSEFYKLTTILTIKNVSKLPLDLDINIKPPFAIIHREGTYKVNASNEDVCDCIQYNTNDLNIQRLLAEMPPHESKVFIDCLTQKPIQRSRQGPLDFFQDINKMKMVFNITNTVQERLEDQEIMKLQILFDTTKHINHKSKIYSDSMRIKFKGHKNKDTVRIVGEINYPNVVVMTPKIDFQCILNGSMESKLITIHNPTNLLVCYTFLWKKCTATRIRVPELSIVDEETSISSKELTEVHKSKSKDFQLDEKSESTSPKRPIEGGDAPKETETPSQEQIESAVPTDSSIQFLNMRKHVLQKIAPMIRIDKDRGFPWSHKFPKPMLRERTFYINDIFLLVPHQGKIKPRETHNIHIIFAPSPNISIRGILECTVLGGPSELITVTGQSSDLLFKLSTQTINFKIKSFHEDATESLFLTNIAQLPIEYKTYLNEPVFENELPATIREIVPPQKTVGPEELISIGIVTRPGVLGYFSRKFLLEIGHRPYITIEVCGWGVIPQIYFALPRTKMTKFTNAFAYNAINTLTEEYLAAVSEFFTKHSAERTGSPPVDKSFDDPIFKDDWHICSASDGYPSVMDIEMAIERCLVVNYLNAKPELMKIFSSFSRGSHIQGFFTVPYLVDFGVMITDTSVTCSVHVVNYGPLSVKMRFSKSYVGYTWLNIKLCGKLDPGESGKMDLVFFPQSHDFPKYEQNLDMTFHIEVPYGASIPINVKSLIAVPFLKSNVQLVDFGSVRCGDKVIISVPLQNVGKPTCVWYAILKIKTPGPNPMLIIEGSGKYEPGEGGWLSISFKPTMEMTYEGMLIFRFHMNPTKMAIPIIGHGVFPHVHIIGPNLNFPPTLPWSDVTELYFGITNPCDFPIELIVAHVDKKWRDEEDMFQLLYKYYNKPDEMLVPAIQPGVGMPKAVEDFFNRFKTDVAIALQHEAAAAMKASTRAVRYLELFED